ncbi:MAG: hypothetical protein U9Q00_07730 [Synergistota bacterium]|nr:hypothetical protein [Synergistota bacterium]
MSSIEILDAVLSRSEVEDALSRWNLEEPDSMDGRLHRLYRLAKPVLAWAYLSPESVERRGGWGPGVSSLMVGGGTVGDGLSRIAEEEGAFSAAMTIALLGKGQERFFEIVRSEGEGKGLPVGVFHTPGSAGNMDLSVNLDLGRGLPLEKLGMSVLPDGQLSPSYSWIGVVPIGEGTDKVTFLCRGCPFHESCPLRRE